MHLRVQDTLRCNDDHPKVTNRFPSARLLRILMRDESQFPRTKPRFPPSPAKSKNTEGQSPMKNLFSHHTAFVPAIAIGIFLSVFSSALHAQTAPSTYSAYTGTDAKVIPPAPALGTANSVIKDPTFGSQILRVTDPNTNSGESFISTDAGFHRTWNANRRRSS